MSPHLGWRAPRSGAAGTVAPGPQREARRRGRRRRAGPRQGQAAPRTAGAPILPAVRPFPLSDGVLQNVPDPDRPAAELRGKVLYIEDQSTNFAVVEAILFDHPKVQLLHAETGLDGVRMVRSERPDFVLLDMHLPDISGLDVVRMLSDEIADRRLRVTILTADNLTLDIIKAMSLGAFEYLVKPVNVRALEASMRRALTTP
jgi:CheY-like chemotaxis protein